MFMCYTLYNIQYQQQKLHIVVIVLSVWNHRAAYLEEEH